MFDFKKKTLAANVFEIIAVIQTLIGVIWFCLNLDTENPWTALLCVIQLAAVVVSGLFCCRAFGLPLYFGLFIISCPFVLYALVTASVVPILASIFLVSVALIQKRVKNSRRKVLFVLVSILLVFLAGFGIKSIAGTDKGAYKVEAAPELLLFRRIAWPKLRDSAYLFGYIMDDGLNNMINEADLVPERIQTSFAPGLEKRTGAEEAKKYYRSVTVNVLENNTKERAEYLLSHFLLIILMPFSFYFVFMFGAQDTVLPRYITDYSAKTPIVSAVFLSLFLIIIVFAFIAGTLIRIMKVSERKLSVKTVLIGILLLLLWGFSVFMFEQPYFNPGKCTFASIIWMAFLALPFCSEKKD